MAFKLTNLLATLDSSIAALDSASELLEVLQAINVTNSTKGHGKTQRKYYTSYASLPTADSALRGMTAVVSTSQVDSGNGLYLCTGTTWTEIQDLDSAAGYSFQGSNYGYTSGGYPSPAMGNTIDKFSFTSDGNATDVGDLTFVIVDTAGQSSSENGYVSGGSASPDPTPGTPIFQDVIQKFSFTSDGNATDVGDLTLARKDLAGQSSENNGYSSGGSNAPTGFQNVIDKFPFATDANATDVGDLTVARNRVVGQNSTENGYASGGRVDPVFQNVIDKFPFASDANATDVGDLTVARGNAANQSSTTHGYSSGGTPYPPGNVIDKFAFASDGNATDVGDLTVGRYQAAGQSSTVSGYSSGGRNFPTLPHGNTIDKFPFAADANATDVGDLTEGRWAVSGQQY